MDNPFAVDRTYVVSVKALREVLKDISTPDTRWWVEDDHEHGVVVGYRAAEHNDILFEFPKIASVPLLPDGEIICLYPVSRSMVQRGLYWQENQLLNDEVRDWEEFWTPIRRGLAKCYSEGSGVRSMSMASTGMAIRSRT